MDENSSILANDQHHPEDDGCRHSYEQIRRKSFAEVDIGVCEKGGQNEAKVEWSDWPEEIWGKYVHVQAGQSDCSD